MIVTEEKIQVAFEINGFRDALYFTPAERAGLSDAALDAMKLERYQAHLARVAAPAQEVAPLTEEQVEAEIAVLTQAQRDNQARIAALASPERLATILAEQESIVGGMKAQLASRKG
jgi:hypothetical protein